MAWTWRFEKMDGTPATARDLPKETFASQSDAETWLGESWRGLLEAGVDQVTLLEEGRTEYGPMRAPAFSAAMTASMLRVATRGMSPSAMTQPEASPASRTAAARL